MAATNDTIDGLLAEFRGYAAGMPASYHVTMSWADFRRLLDRFDAAHKRERGNAAKLREALKHIKDRLPHMLQYMRIHWEDANAGGYFDELMLVIDAALAAQPRNCDIYLTEEAVDAATVTVRDCEACSRIDMEAPCVFCMVRWLLAPATEQEGGAK